MSDLARRAVSCRHWRWLPGMRRTDGSRMLCAGDDLDGDWQAWIYEDYDSCACKVRRYQARGDIPDLSDPATLGCLLALVREAYRCPTLHAWYSRQLGCWVVSANGQEIGVQESSEARALVAALEAAP